MSLNLFPKKVKVIERLQEIEIAEHEISRKNFAPDSQIRKPAEAEKFRLETIAEAEKQEIIMEAEAEAEALALKGELDVCSSKVIEIICLAIGHKQTHFLTLKFSRPKWSTSSVLW